MFLLSAGESLSEPQVDWLMFSRLGSPDVTPRDAPVGGDVAAAADKPSASAPAGKDRDRQSEGAQPAGRTPASGRKPKADSADSRRGSLFDDKSLPDWLEMAADGSAEKKPPSSSGQRSFDSTQDEDRLGAAVRTRSTTDRADSASDYLGLGSEIDLAAKPSR